MGRKPAAGRIRRGGGVAHRNTGRGHILRKGAHCASLALALALALALLAGGPLAAQQSEPVLPWTATLHYETLRTAPGSDGAFWHTATAGIGRRYDGGSVMLQGMITRRFEQTDQVGIIDLYQDLWRGAYANVRLAAAPDAEVVAEFDGGAELFVPAGPVELSGSFRRQLFEVTDVNTLGAGIGIYAGQWYLRPRGLAARIDDSWSPFFVVSGRRFLGESTDNYLELTAGAGDEVLEIAAPAAGTGPLDVITSGSRFAAARGQRFFGPRFGGTVGFTYSDYADIPNRWGATAGLITRF